MDDEISIEAALPRSHVSSPSKRKKKTLSEIELLIRKKDQGVNFEERPKRNENSSPVWESFRTIHVNGIRQDFVRCIGCEKVVRYVSIHGTNGLKKHIQSCSKLFKSNDGTQTTITSHYLTRSDKHTDLSNIPKRFATQMVRACAEYCSVDGRAFESISGAGIKKVFQVAFDAGRACGAGKRSIDVQHLLPSSTTV